MKFEIKKVICSALAAITLSTSVVLPSALTIKKNGVYFVNSMDVMAAKDQSPKYPEPTRTLSLKSPYMNGDDVKWVQNKILELYLIGDIRGNTLNTSVSEPAVCTVDGIYGPNTNETVKDFQSRYGLGVSGNFGKKSTTVMKAVTGMDTSLYDFYSYTQPTKKDVLKSGDKGSKVKWLQCSLNYLIFFGDNNNKQLKSKCITEINGQYNDATKKAVSEFQKKYKLKVTGKFGEKDIEKMVLCLPELILVDDYIM